MLRLFAGLDRPSTKGRESPKVASHRSRSAECRCARPSAFQAKRQGWAMRKQGFHRFCAPHCMGAPADVRHESRPDDRRHRRPLSDTAGGTLSGVTVEVTSPSLQGTRVAVFRSGRHLSGFQRCHPVNTWFGRLLRVSARLRRQPTVPLDGTAEVDLVLEPRATEEVVVSGEAPVIDPDLDDHGNELHESGRGEVDRNYADIVRSNPGVSTDGADTQGRSLALSIYGAPRSRTSSSSTASIRPTSSLASRARPSPTSSSRRSRSRPAAMRPSSGGRSAGS